VTTNNTVVKEVIDVKREDIYPFLRKYVKLVQHNGFVLDGKIDKISEDSVVFITKQATSVIDIKVISTIVLKRGG
jgi:hypothetical protein